MAGKSTGVLLVTANVGSIFEDPSVMLKIWTEEFLSTVTRLDPKFIALHCQEVGGKNYECSMKHVEYFVRLLMSSDELRLFDKVRVYLDEDYSSAENFTALGNFYFIHESVSDVLVWDFSAMAFVSAKGKEVHSGNIEAVSTKEKSKFPQDFFPECKWSRKGFLRTRWSLSGTVLDFINIHLFHDASNFVAMESFPSVYCKNRRRALEHTLERFHKDDYGTAPFFVFGDFNFRTDAQGVVKKLAEGLTTVRVQSNRSTDHTKLQYRDADSQVILQVGKKEFSHQDHQTVFIQDNEAWLKEFDSELEPFSGRLYEFPINFQPSYPFEEDRKKAESYMKTRCPSWCDRVLLSISAKSLVSNISEPSSVQYGLMGASTCMGDHKPVYLKMHLNSDAGMILCGCIRESAPCFGLFLPADATPHWPLSHVHRSSELDHNTLSSMLLAARCMTVDSVATGGNSHLLLPPPAHALLHDPYTPESMETPSSSPTPSLTPQFEFEDKFGRESDSHEDNTQIYVPEFQRNTEDKVNKWHLVTHENTDCINCRRDWSIKKVWEELDSVNEVGRSNATDLELCNSEIKFSCGRGPEDALKIPYIRFSDCDKIINSSQASSCSKNVFKNPDSLSVIPHIYDDYSSSVLEEASPHSKELNSHCSDSQILNKNREGSPVFQDSAAVVIHVDSASCTSELEIDRESVQVISDTTIEERVKLPLCQETECNNDKLVDTELQKHLGKLDTQNVDSLPPESIERSHCLEEHLETYHGELLNSNSSKYLSSDFCNPEDYCESKSYFFETANKSKIEITDPSYSLKCLTESKNCFPTESDKSNIQRDLKSKVSYNKVFELSNLRLLNNAISKFRNEAATVQKSSLKNLFRSASAPLYLCSSRCREKQIPCLFISGTHSCGDISATYDTQNREVCFNVPSAREELPSEQEACRRNESDSSSSTHNLNRGNENASTSKRYNRKHFKCCVLL